MTSDVQCFHFFYNSTKKERNNFRFHGMSSCWLFSSFDGFGGKMKMTAINDFVFGDTFSPSQCRGFKPLLVVCLA